jgi:exonuclease III
MSLKLVTHNVNGLRDNRKRELMFNWLVSKKYDCICLQETHCTGVDIYRWKSEWKAQGGDASAWLCGSSESKGVAILLNKHFAFDINFYFSDKTCRLLTCEINTENAIVHIFNIYTPNLYSDRKQFFDSFQNISYNHEDDSIYHYNIVLGYFNYILDNKIYNK